MNFLKKRMNPSFGYLTAFFLAAMIIAGFSQHTYADEPEEEPRPEFRFEDEDLLRFVDANMEIQKVQRETQESIVETVEEHGLTMERFNQIARASQIGALQGGSFSQEEIDAFNEVAPKVTEIQRDMQGMVQLIMQEHEIAPDLYQEILADYRQDPELQEYVRELLRERRREEIRQERLRELEEEKREQEEE